MKLTLLMLAAALVVAGCASNSNSGNPPTDHQISGGQGQQNSGTVYGENNGVNNNTPPSFNQWRYQGITPTTP